MFTDMVGYTALGQRNEALSLALVDEQRQLIRPLLRRHNGREVKTIGDAFLVEFPSALDAVRCAYDIQRATREFNISLSDEKRIHLRIGVHLGDVVESRGDISGDAVNVASKIEALAEDGGVCLTRQVYDHVQSKFDLPITSLGLKTLKNVSAPLEVYRMVMPWEQAWTSPSTQLDSKRIAILPFANLSPDPNDSYFADGITEEIISTVSNVSGLSVISRTSVMGYKGTTKRVGEIGNELKVGSVLEGSFRKAGDKIRITTQLIDTKDDRHVWAQSYDREFDDVFAVQTDIAKQVADALKVRILPAEKERIERAPTVSTGAFSLYLKGRFYWNERTEESVRTAIQYFEKAIERDPKYALAYSGLADCYSILANYAFVEPKAALAKAKEFATKALEIDSSLAEAHTSLGQVLYDADWEWSRSEAEFRKAIELNPNYATAHHWLGISLGVQEGRGEEGIAQVKIALGLDPLSKVIQTSLAGGYWYTHREQEAIQELEKAIQSDPDYYNFHDYLGMVYCTIGRYEESIAELEKAIRLGGDLLVLKADLGYVSAKAGKTAEALGILDELNKISGQKYVSPLLMAEIQMGLRDREKCLYWIERAFQERAADFRTQVTSPIYHELRTSSRFVAILANLGVLRA